jgi:transcriptional regulator
MSAPGTLRQQVITLLMEGEMDARQLSQALHISEKDVYPHLEHISCTLARQGKKIGVIPFRCLACGYEFKDRNRFRRPGRCPVCKESHIAAAVYRINSDPSA